MNEEQLRIELDSGETVTAIRTDPIEETKWLFVYAPGAGSNVNDAFGRYVSKEIASAGISVIRFQFPYMELKKRRPDRPAVLESTWRSAIRSAKTTGGRLVVGGRSMGGRIASQVVAEGVEVDALALFAYPLHPPGNPEKMRDGHLPEIAVPTLLCSGTRDDFGTPAELAVAAAKVPSVVIHLLDGADHGFSPLKASGRRREDVWEEAVGVFVEWLEGLRD